MPLGGSTLQTITLLYLWLPVGFTNRRPDKRLEDGKRDSSRMCSLLPGLVWSVAVFFFQCHNSCQMAPLQKPESSPGLIATPSPCALRLRGGRFPTVFVLHIAPSLPGSLNLPHGFVNYPFIKPRFTFLFIVGQPLSMELGTHQFGAGSEPPFRLSLLFAETLESQP